ncbi:transporter [Oxalicibacterium flavum]|uniref:Transporter n=1 Tax=Oxalicibacterium flavum TaxID=179467 RepID=A0A8J2XXB2_9BURK|nr:copper chaperone PCu(A)C [Oxalicibacterium flavum]GGB99374.1 transporter [Oxalicibacterium flavum]
MKNFLFAVFLLTFSIGSMAQITVADPWVRGMVSGQKSTGAFMQLNSAEDTRLVDASSPDFVVEIHEMSMHGDVMRMKQIDGIDLPAGKTVELKPGSYHLMFIDVKRQLKEGDMVPLTLRFENAQQVSQTVKVNVPVKALNSTGPAMSEKHQHNH